MVAVRARSPGHLDGGKQMALGLTRHDGRRPYREQSGAERARDCPGWNG
jgi:hypothetical protein